MKKLLFILLAFLTTCAPGYALTLSNIRTEIRRNVDDTDSSRQRYTDAVILDYINEAQKEIVNTTWLSEEVTSYILSPLTTFYVLPTDAINVNRIDFDDKNRNSITLERVTLAGLERNPNWRKDTGQPIQYYVDESSTTNELIITYIPIPTVSSTGTVRIRYYSQVTDLASDSEVPFNGKRHLYPYHFSVVYHVTMRLKAREKKLNESLLYQGYYKKSIGILNERIKSIPDYSPGIRTE